MKSSIVFAPETDERALDREVKKIDRELNKAGTIKPDLDTSQLDGVGTGIGGGRRGGGAGVGASAGAGALASKLPKPIAGVSVSAALPVALGGAVGVGMLKAMHSSSARLQTSTSLISQAWNNVWRPIGDKVDQLFIRDKVTDLLGATQGFEDAFRSSDWLVDPIVSAFANSITWDMVGLSQDFEELMENMAGRLSWESVIPAFKWPDIGTPEIPDWRNLAPGVPDWRGIVPGIPDWSNLSAKKFIQWATGGGKETKNPGKNNGTPPKTNPGGGTPPSGPPAYMPGRGPPGTKPPNDGGGDPGTCFVGSSTVRTPGGRKRIDELAVGDVVVSYDETRGHLTTSTIGEVIVHETATDHDFTRYPLLLVTVADADGNEYETRVTANHLYLLEDGRTYRQIGEIDVGATLKFGGETATLVGKTELNERPDVVYNLHMADGPHNYIVHGAVVHNAKMPARQMAAGGVVRRPTNAVVGEAGPEAVLPLDSFLRDLEGTIRAGMNNSGGGGGATGDMRRVERKLDDLNRNLKRLSRAMSDMNIQVDGETFGRLATNSQQRRVNDMDPTI